MDLRMFGRSLDARAVRPARGHTMDHGRGRGHEDVGCDLAEKRGMRWRRIVRNGWEALKVPCHQRRASPSLRSWKGRHASVDCQLRCQRGRRCIAITKHRDFASTNQVDFLVIYFLLPSALMLSV